MRKVLDEIRVNGWPVRTVCHHGLVKVFSLSLMLSLPLSALAELPSATSPGVQGLHGVDKFYCHGVAVVPGDRTVEVRAKCGNPAWSDISGGVSSEQDAPGSYAEEWVYDFGHDQLVEFLRFRNGRLVTIRSGTHGFGGSRDGDCGYGANLSLGDTKLEVVAKCGEPTDGVPGGASTPMPDDAGERHRYLLGIDQWVYNFGPDRPVHYLIFRHGRLMEIRSGGIGW